MEMQGHHKLGVESQAQTRVIFDQVRANLGALCLAFVLHCFDNLKSFTLARYSHFRAIVKDFSLAANGFQKTGYYCK